ncbi:MAG: hypothetical protein ACXVJD_13520 [Mucilaginibacter sp.]
MSFTVKTPLKLFATCIILFSCVSAKAQMALPAQVLASNSNRSPQTATDTAYFNSDPRLLENTGPMVLGLKRSAEQRRLLGYLKALKVAENPESYSSRQKFYYHLAGIFAHLKMYPLAMKCFFKSRTNIESAAADSTHLNSANLIISAQDDSLVSRQAVFEKADRKEIKSKIINYKSINSIFNDGKTTATYAMLFHVKQPVPGKGKIFLWANTGHTFITLIKYNKDSTYVSASFGFYPVKEQLLSATPLAPTTSATFRDDSGHKWDEVLGRFISRRKFEKILALASDYQCREYNLNSNNCTDFGIQAAAIAGIKVIETSGKWPLGKGNNPGITGQSILQGNFIDTETAGAQNLFEAER